MNSELSAAEVNDRTTNELLAEGKYLLPDFGVVGFCGLTPVRPYWRLELRTPLIKSQVQRGPEPMRRFRVQEVWLKFAKRGYLDQISSPLDDISSRYRAI